MAHGIRLSGAPNVSTASWSFIGFFRTRFADPFVPGKTNTHGAPQGTRLARGRFWDPGVADFHHWSGSCEPRDFAVPRGFHDKYRVPAAQSRSGAPPLRYISRRTLCPESSVRCG